MANIKKLSCAWVETGQTIYCIIRRESDLYLFNDDNGGFSVSPTDPYLSLSENSTIKGLYEVSESRTIWNDGEYLVVIYKQTGSSPLPSNDIVIAAEVIKLIEDEIISIDIQAVNGESVTNIDEFKADVSNLATEDSVLALGSPLQTNDSRLNYLDASISSRSTLTAQNVWEYTTRTLTSFGTLVSDITSSVWNATTRTLTSFGNLVTDIWGYVTRSLTDKSNFTLTSDYNAAKTAATQTSVNEINNKLDNSTYGLSAIQTLIEEDVLLGMQEEFDDIKGSGWTDESLKNIKDGLDLIPTNPLLTNDGRISRMLGLMLENHVEDDIVRNEADLKTSSIIYVYDSKQNALLHDKTTGLIASYTVSIEYGANNLVTLFKVVKN